MISKQELSNLISYRRYTLRELGDIFGVSRERIHQLFVKYNLQQLPKVKGKMCKCCGSIIQKSPRKVHWIKLYCFICGKDFERLLSNHKRNFERYKFAKQGIVFCSKYCQGVFTGQRYGFCVHPPQLKYPTEDFSLSLYYRKKIWGICTSCTAPIAKDRSKVYCDKHLDMMNQRDRMTHVKD